MNNSHKTDGSLKMPKKLKLEEITVGHLKIDDEYDIISNNATIVESAKKMKEKNIPDLVVVDDDNKVLGTVSTFDIVSKIVADSKSTDVHITEIMEKVCPFSLTTKITDAFDEMKEKQVEVVPVTNDKNKLLGVVTVMDVFSAIEAFS